ncbi:hypothetical protein L1987_05105 [Smallanthus sonchifolius]|uniref:Uncharacterized protein n=1 Tax=Smallanthus sonchifolius TaxID=185202 RepID=A0ACB9JUF4_9ASTR|nr:hypothetical protein L1987_05105 [Smallanthus sonchifolius]
MDVEMEDDNSSGGDTAVEFTFTAVEIDIDYEFEAARFFDFTRTESIDEAVEAEMWFDSVESYPPSRKLLKSVYIANLCFRLLMFDEVVLVLVHLHEMLLSQCNFEVSPIVVVFSSLPYVTEDEGAQNIKTTVKANKRLLSRGKSENANGSTVSKGFDNTNQLDRAFDVVRAQGDSTMDLSNTDMANGGVPLDLKSYCLQQFHKQQSNSSIPKDNTRNAIYKSKTKSSWKPSLPRTSTLMKPTASQLAKQNQERVIDHFRFKKFGNNSSGVESQAAKRQKLEGGHLCKVTDTKQQTNLVHKAPKRVSCLNDGNLGHGRLRITVPRPPDLATAQRAERIRQKGDDVTEHVASRDPGFRARPLNRKIFKAPPLLHQKRSTPQLPVFQAPKKPSLAFGTESSSRESKGYFQAFNFQTEKRAQHAPVPPVDLFKKLSLASESGYRPSISTKVIPCPFCDLKDFLFEVFTDLHIMLAQGFKRKQSMPGSTTK